MLGSRRAASCVWSIGIRECWRGARRPCSLSWWSWRSRPSPAPRGL